MTSSVTNKQLIIYSFNNMNLLFISIKLAILDPEVDVSIKMHGLKLMEELCSYMEELLDEI